MKILYKSLMILSLITAGYSLSKKNDLLFWFLCLVGGAFLGLLEAKIKMDIYTR